MSKFIREYEEKRGLSEKIASYIPGYRGYKQKEIRREADRLLRDFMVKKLETARAFLKEISREVADSDRADLFKMLNRLSAILDRVVNKVEHADYGYSGFFDLLKIREEELDRLVDYDHRLLVVCEEISKDTEEARDIATAGSLDQLPHVIRNLRSKVVEFESTFMDREETIVSLKGGA